jgi:hypothetical protein
VLYGVIDGWAEGHLAVVGTRTSGEPMQYCGAGADGWADSAHRQ